MPQLLFLNPLPAILSLPLHFPLKKTRVVTLDSHEESRITSHLKPLNFASSAKPPVRSQPQALGFGRWQLRVEGFPPPTDGGWGPGE